MVIDADDEETYLMLGGVIHRVEIFKGYFEQIPLTIRVDDGQGMAFACLDQADINALAELFGRYKKEENDETG